MINQVLALSLLGWAVSFIWWMVSTSALNNYATSQGIEPRLAFLLFGMIWKDRQNPVRLQLIGFFASTISMLLCLGVGMASGHH